MSRRACRSSLYSLSELAFSLKAAVLPLSRRTDRPCGRRSPVRSVRLTIMFGVSPSKTPRPRTIYRAEGTMRSIATLAVVLACTACQPQPDSMQVATMPGEAQLAQNEPQLNCRDLTAPITVGGRPEQANTRACQQPDGSWRITQTTPGLPPQVYVVPPPAEYPYGSAYSDYYGYPSYYPYWAAEPWFFGLGPTIVVARRFPHFHHGFGHGFDGGFAHGFHGGFGHGFHGGFGHGFHGGFAHGFHAGFAHGFHGGFG